MDNILKSSRTEYWFSVFLASYPILCMYKAFGSFTIGDVILFMFMIVTVLTKRKVKDFPKSFLCFGLYVFVISLIDQAISSDYSIQEQFESALIRQIKLAFYIIGVVFVSNNFLNQRVLQRSLIFIGIIVSLFMIFQNIMFWGMGKIVLGQIPGLTVYLEEYTVIDYETIYSHVFRPSSLFLEPAMISQYVIVSLIFTLFSDDKIKYRIFVAVLLTISILMSTSAQGVFYLAITYLFYILFRIKRKYISVFILCLLVIIMIWSYENIEPIKFSIDRLLYSENASGARLDTYSYCFELEPIQMLFGNGYGCTRNNEYFAGGAYVWYGTGLVGLCFAVYLFGRMFSKHNKLITNLIVLIFFVMFWSTALFYNYMFFWFFSIILGTSNLYKKRNA